MRRFQNQVHRKGAKDAKGMLYDPIVKGDWIINLMPLTIENCLLCVLGGFAVKI